VTRHAPGPQELILAQVLLKVRWVWSHGEYVEAVRGMTSLGEDGIGNGDGRGLRDWERKGARAAAADEE